MQTITILGATGSIGCNTLDVIARHPDRYRVFAITANTQAQALIQQAQKFAPRYAVLTDANAYEEAKTLAVQANLDTEILYGTEALNAVASDQAVDAVMAAIVGAAGLLPTMAAVRAGKRVLLANKEALVMTGELFINAAKHHNAQIIPIDSEHNAIFQALPHDYVYGETHQKGIAKLLLTGSGGPFLRTPLEDFANLTPDQACAHPNWDMGRKISVDSATMMNKGLEFIEARWLFGVEADDIEVVLHPQSTIHSMVQYIDGSVIAQLGQPDMRTPIAYGLAYPERIDAGVSHLDFSQLADFTFTKPCMKRYPNLALAIAACKAGQAATTQLNAANEIAVEAFLAEQIRFTDIAKVNEQALNQLEPITVSSIQQVLEIDKSARVVAKQIIQAQMNG
ncbi:1-deoxy-D-xylulose-5-phosphate reductoisomerase [Alteromonas sp. ASW11-36]|uniref:1-deoxy-D-xylulose 5-phosphate reductoisomerase n=1 Tax=Alteromonas arenosi TaxID=3055817 RepID=A0ABT7SW18_9ALTE|nr:1-deoxy-D-xylulose-5-phosphate reductoisomerase [Alteromonas sp. ASW11-36]MDM7860209.1 1-deoxy-D-xylulose-5-phosphate reductoisomerase [Alteromonas sp. ASW11-36]